MTAGGAIGGSALTPGAALALYLTNTGLVGAPATAITNLTNSLDSAGLWSKMDMIYPMPGTTANINKYNLKNPLDTDAAKRVTWGGTVTHNANGVQSDGSTGYGNTHFNPAVSARSNDAHFSVYSRTNASSGSYTTLGGSGFNFGLYLRTGAGYTNGGLQSFFALNTYAVFPNTLGFFVVNRRDSANVRFGQNGVTTSKADASTTFDSVEVFLLASNNAGVPNAPSTRNYAWFAFGRGLTDQNETDLYTVVQAYQTAMSRQV